MKPTPVKVHGSRARSLPPLDKLKECFVYDEATGELFWKHRPLGHFSSSQHQGSFNSQFASKVAGYVDGSGYKRIKVFEREYMAHRIVYFLATGEQPPTVDHVDGDKLNNRIANLRPATQGENNRNSPAQSNNKTGIKGVRLHKNGKWAAQGTHAGKNVHLGLFVNIADAEAAAIKFRNEMHGEFANHGYKQTGVQQ